MDMKNNKKGLEIGMLYPVVMTLVLVIVLTGLGVLITEKISLSVGGSAGTAINAGRDALATLLTNWSSIIVIVIAAAIIIGLVVSGFVMQSKR